MAKYQADAEKLLKEIGGKENIAAVSHCATRMRFVLNDPKKANEEAIEDIPSVKGMFTMLGNSKSLLVTMFQPFTTTSLLYQVLKAYPRSKVKLLLNKISTLSNEQSLFWQKFLHH